MRKIILGSIAPGSNPVVRLPDFFADFGIFITEHNAGGLVRIEETLTANLNRIHVHGLGWPVSRLNRACRPGARRP